MQARKTERLVLLLCWLALPPGLSANERPAWQGGATEIAAGSGTKGPWRQNDSGYDYVDDGAVAIGPRGELALAWVDQRSKDVFLRGPGGNVANVSRNGETFSWLPRIAFAPHDGRRIYVLWQEIIFSGGSHGGDILFARSSDGGRSFTPPRNLSRSVGGDGKGRISRDVWDNGSLDLAAAADGAVYAAWTDYEGSLYLSVSADGSGSFTAPRRIAGDPERPARAPSLALGPDRAVYLAWTHGEDRSANIQVARSIDGGASFGEAMTVARTGAFSDAPRLAVDARGTLHLAWAEGSRIVYSRSKDGARSFEPPRRLSERPGGFPFVGVDRASNVCVAWERLDGRRAHGLAYAVSRNGGRRFTLEADVPGSAAPRDGSNGSQQGRLGQKLAVGPDGALALVNSSLEPGKASRVWLIRGAL